MKPEGAMYQATTQVNGFSPEIFHVIDADVFHFNGRQYLYSQIKRDCIESIGVLNSCMIQDGSNVDLGEPQYSHSKIEQEYVNSGRNGRGFAKGVVVVGLTDSTLSTLRSCTWGSGQQCCNGFSVEFPNSQRLEVWN